MEFMGFKRVMRFIGIVGFIGVHCSSPDNVWQGCEEPGSHTTGSIHVGATGLPPLGKPANHH